MYKKDLIPSSPLVPTKIHHISQPGVRILRLVNSTTVAELRNILSFSYDVKKALILHAGIMS